MDVSSLKIDDRKKISKVNVDLDSNCVVVHDRTKYFPVRKLELRNLNEKQILYICESNKSQSIFKTLSLNIQDTTFRATVLLPCIIVRIEGGVLLPLNFEREVRVKRKRGLKSKSSLSISEFSQSLAAIENSNAGNKNEEDAPSLKEQEQVDLKSCEEFEEDDEEASIIDSEYIVDAYEVEAEEEDDEDDEEDEEESIFSDMSNITDLGCVDDFEF